MTHEMLGSALSGTPKYLQTPCNDVHIKLHALGYMCISTRRTGRCGKAMTAWSICYEEQACVLCRLGCCRCTGKLRT